MNRMSIILRNPGTFDNIFGKNNRNIQNNNDSKEIADIYNNNFFNIRNSQLHKIN